MEFNPDDFNEASAVIYCVLCDTENPQCDECGRDIQYDDTYYCDGRDHLCFDCYQNKRNKYYHDHDKETETVVC